MSVELIVRVSFQRQSFRCWFKNVFHNKTQIEMNQPDIVKSQMKTCQEKINFQFSLYFSQVDWQAEKKFVLFTRYITHDKRSWQCAIHCQVFQLCYTRWEYRALKCKYRVFFFIVDLWLNQLRILLSSTFYFLTYISSIYPRCHFFESWACCGFLRFHREEWVMFGTEKVSKSYIFTAYDRRVRTIR